MRMLLFFDLPSVTKQDKKIYRNFVKALKKDGFYSIQESVYVKMALNQQVVDSIGLSVRNYAPDRGSVMILTVTEKQFASMNIILGAWTSDVITSDSRMITL